MKHTRQQDPRREALAAVLDQWRIVLQRRRVSAKEVIDIATDFQTAGADDKRHYLHPEFREALLVVAGEAGNISIYMIGNGFVMRAGAL